MSSKYIQITNYHRLIKSGMDCDHVEGYFNAEPAYTFEIFFEDEPSEYTYKDTKILEMYIKKEGSICWSWAGPPLDKEPETDFKQDLLSKLLSGLKTQIPDLEKEFNTKRGENLYIVMADPATSKERPEKHKKEYYRQKEITRKKNEEYLLRAGSKPIVRRYSGNYSCRFLGILIRQTTKYYIYAEGAHKEDKPLESFYEQRIWKDGARDGAHIEPCYGCEDHPNTRHPTGHWN